MLKRVAQELTRLFHPNPPKGYEQIKKHIENRYERWKENRDYSFEARNIHILYDRTEKKWLVYDTAGSGIFKPAKKIHTLENSSGRNTQKELLEYLNQNLYVIVAKYYK